MLRFHFECLQELTSDDALGSALQGEEDRRTQDHASSSSSSSSSSFLDDDDDDSAGGPSLSLLSQRSSHGSGLALFGRGLGAECVLLLLIQVHLVALKERTRQQIRRREFEQRVGPDLAAAAAANASAASSSSPSSSSSLLTDPIGCVVVLGVPDNLRTSLFEHLWSVQAANMPGSAVSAELSSSSSTVPLVVDGTMSAQDREKIYQSGNVVFCTNQIALMDALFERLKPEWCAGVVVWRAENVTEHNQVSFTIRLLRAGRQRLRRRALWKASRLKQFSALAGPGRVKRSLTNLVEDDSLPRLLFVQALSEDPSGILRGGFNSVSRLLNILGIPPHRLFLWPVFRDVVKEELSGSGGGGALSVFQYRIPMTELMEKLQSSIVSVSLEVVREIYGRNGAFHTSTTENGVPTAMLTPDFASRVLSELRPQWDRLGPTARHLAYDIRSLRRLLFAVVNSDSVSFWHQLRQIAESSGEIGVWNLSEQASVVFQLAEIRVVRPAEEKNRHLLVDSSARHDNSSCNRALFADCDDGTQVVVVESDDDQVGFDIDFGTDDVSMPPSSAPPPLVAELDERKEKPPSPAPVDPKPSIFEVFRDRTVSLELEEPPKWLALQQVIDDIFAQDQRRQDHHPFQDTTDDGPILILCRDSRTIGDLCSMLSGPEATPTARCFSLLRQRWDQFKDKLGSKNTNSRGPLTNSLFADLSSDHVGSAVARIRAQQQQKSQADRERAQREAEEAAKADVEEPPSDSDSENEDGARGEEDQDTISMTEPARHATATRSSSHNPTLDDLLIGEEDIRLPLQEFSASSERILMYSYGPRPGSGDCAMSQLSAFMNDVKPRHICLYDIDLAAFRVIQRYAKWASGTRDHVQLHVLAYDGGCDTQMYEHAIKVEQQAFVDLIKEKSVILRPTLTTDSDGAVLSHQMLDLPPIPEYAMGAGNGVLAVSFQGRKIYEAGSKKTTRGGGTTASESSSSSITGKLAEAPRPQIIVDSRELRSNLPSILFGEGFRLIPAAIDVGDYVLTTFCAVERKDLQDLIQSLASGRLYTQALQLCAYYDYPVLCIEFDDSREPFRLKSWFEGEEIPRVHSSLAKLAILLLNFPRLRVIWAKNPKHAAAIFARIKSSALRLAITADIHRASLVASNSSGSRSNVIELNADPPEILPTTAEEFWNQTSTSSRSLPDDDAATAASSLDLSANDSSSSSSARPSYEPSLARVKIADGEEELESQPVKMLLQLPGIDRNNVKTVMHSVKNLFQLSRMSEQELQALIGPSNGKDLYQFFHQSHRSRASSSQKESKPKSKAPAKRQRKG